jgi:hypothetical protein
VPAPEVEVDELLAGFDDSRPLYEAVDALALSLGDVRSRITRTQVAYRRRRTFALFWIPARHRGRGPGIPVVLSIVRDHQMASSRFKETLAISPGRWLHHLELRDVAELDDEVHEWLLAAADEAT